MYGWIKIPVNLLPDVDPPEILIEVRQSGISANLMDRTVLSPIRQSVIGSLGLEDIQSEATRGFGRVMLSYEFGTQMDLAVIEVNEKIDRVLSQLPPDIERPLVKKKKPTDIPFIRVHLSSEVFDIAKLSESVKFEFTKRFEQLVGVTKIESNGTVQKSIRLIPKNEKIIAAGLDLNGISELVASSNFPIGQVLVRDGNYEYIIQIENLLKDVSYLKSLRIPIKSNEQQVLLSDLFSIEESYLNPQNKHLFNGTQGVVMAIYNQPNADLFKLESDVLQTIEQLKLDFPKIHFTTSQNQVNLLRDNINQLYLTAGLAAFFAFGVFFLSHKSKRLPLILGTVIPSAIFIAIGVLWMIGYTLNIITMSGFILGIGLLVDNVIILAEEINQNRTKGLSVKEACITSAKNIFPALLSSTLTTICVFIPLLALDGIASSLFKEQAIALIIILAVSLALTFILIPTYYNLWIKKEVRDFNWISYIRNKSHKSWPRVRLGIIFFLLAIGLVSFMQLKITDLPAYSSNAYQIKILWNESISIEENERRIRNLIDFQEIPFSSTDLGISNITQNELNFFDEANIYLKTISEDQAKKLVKSIVNRASTEYPTANASYSRATNIFEMIFIDDQPLAEARIRKNDASSFSKLDLEALSHGNENGKLTVDINETFQIIFQKDRVENSDIAYPVLVDHLKNLTDENIITTLKNIDQTIPITISNGDLDYFINIDEEYFNLASFYEIKDTTEIRTITADLSGAYISFTSDNVANAISFGEEMSQKKGWVYDIKGSLLDSEKSIQNLILASVLSIMILYLVLVIQFESFRQPLIIFAMMPLAVMGSLIGLYCYGGTINIMSIIGIVVMLGIIVNDSILKIDAINRNIKSGLLKKESIRKAKDERFKPILMTSVSTIFAMIPVLFSSGISSDIQKPLAIVVICGLFVGTWSSIALLPRFYDALK